MLVAPLSRKSLMLLLAPLRSSAIELMTQEYISNCDGVAALLEEEEEEKESDRGEDAEGECSGREGEDGERRDGEEREVCDGAAC